MLCDIAPICNTTSTYSYNVELNLQFSIAKRNSSISYRYAQKLTDANMHSMVFSLPAALLIFTIEKSECTAGSCHPANMTKS